MTANLTSNIWKLTNFLENTNNKFNKEEILSNLPADLIDDAIKSISTWESYSPTPLVKLNKLNDQLKFKNIYYKDEDKRFDLNLLKL